MNVRSMGLWAGLGMVLTSAGALAIPVADQPSRLRPDPKAEVGGTGTADPSHFSAGDTLTIDARLGHASVGVAPAGSTDTFLFASVTGADRAASAAPPLDVSIVIDRSGSMAGKRIANALAAAVGIVERMRDSDTVSVVSFDTRARVVVPPTAASSSAKPTIEAAIRSIRLGGDTCISCGLEQAMQELELTTSDHDQVRRIVLLSDGEATDGIKDVLGMRTLAGGMRDHGVSISTIGVDVTFDEKLMAALATESNGRHYFVANADQLPDIFAQEFDSLVASVASDGELEVELAPGVDVEQVFDRSFRREGSRVLVPFGTFSAKQEKTVLMKLRIPAGREGLEDVARLRLTYRDLVNRADGSCRGDLALAVRSDGTEQKELDPFVAGRVERSRTAQTLTDANKLFEQGRVVEARAVLAKQKDEVGRTESVAVAQSHAAPAKARGQALDADFASQQRAIASAEANFSTPAAAPNATAAASARAGKAAVRENQENAHILGF